MHYFDCSPYGEHNQIQTTEVIQMSLKLGFCQHRVIINVYTCLFWTQLSKNSAKIMYRYYTSWNYVIRVSLVAQSENRLPAMQETWFRSLSGENPLETAMATYSSIPAWKTPRIEESGGLQSLGSQRVGHDLATKTKCGIMGNIHI